MNWLKVVILICQVGMPIKDCNQANANDVLIVPEDANSPFDCMLKGQEYLGGSNIPILKGQKVQILCIPPQKLPKNVG